MLQSVKLIVQIINTVNWGYMSHFREFYMFYPKKYVSKKYQYNFMYRVLSYTESSKYYARIQTAVARGLGLPAGRQAGRLTDAASKHSLCYFSSFSEYMVTHIDVHLRSGDVSVYWLWLLLCISAVSVVIVIIAISDMPRQEFSLYERVYIHNAYM